MSHSRWLLSPPVGFFPLFVLQLRNKAAVPGLPGDGRVFRGRRRDAVKGRLLRCTFLLAPRKFGIRLFFPSKTIPQSVLGFWGKPWLR